MKKKPGQDFVTATNTPPEHIDPLLREACHVLSSVVDGLPILTGFSALMSVLMTTFVNELPNAPHPEAEQALRDHVRMGCQRLLSFVDLPADQIKDTVLAMGDNQPKH